MPYWGSVLPDRSAVHPQLDGLPLLRRRGAGEQAEDGGADDHDQPAQRLDGLAVLVEVRLLLRGRRVHRARAVAEVQAPADGAAHDEEPEHEQDRARAPLGADHVAEPELLVPEDLGPHLGQDQHDDDEHPEDDERGGERSASARARRARAGRRASEGHGVAVLVVGNRVSTVSSTVTVTTVPATRTDAATRTGERAGRGTGSHRNATMNL